MEEEPASNAARESTAVGNILQSLYNITQGGPSCQIVVDHQTEVYKEDEDVRGVIIINTQNESQVVVHDGIKISLIGIIGKDSLCYIF